jgi:hypothetical protein
MRPEIEPGSRPLVDEKMGWQTGAGPLQHRAPQVSPGAGGNIATEKFSRSTMNRSWIILVALMLAGLTVGILIAMQSSGS